MGPPLDQRRYHLRLHVGIQLLLVLGDSRPYPVNSSRKKAQVLFLDDLLGVLPSFSARGSGEGQSWTLPEPLGLSGMWGRISVTGSTGSGSFLLRAQLDQWTVQDNILLGNHEASVPVEGKRNSGDKTKTAKKIEDLFLNTDAC